MLIGVQVIKTRMTESDQAVVVVFFLPNSVTDSRSRRADQLSDDRVQHSTDFVLSRDYLPSVQKKSPCFI